MRIVDPRDILISPVVSEKAYGLLDQNKYTFIVSPDANKTQIKIAVEEVFGVKVTSVNTMNREGKRVRTRTGFGRKASTPSKSSNASLASASNTTSASYVTTGAVVSMNMMV